MDADFKEERRKRNSLREKRWSMNSQRLEEILAELMRPIGDLRRNFDTDLSALLEEYLTEAGLHALDAADSEDEDGRLLSAGAAVVPNFAELALLLQQSASIYGRKVDFLYQHVISISDSLQNTSLEMANTSAEEPAHLDETQTPGGSRRKRKQSATTDFTHIELEASNGARREPGAARPPPTLPRMYIELEPRVMGEGEAPLRDYQGEPIGLLADYHVAYRIQNGLLVEELDGYEERAALRPIPLMELQAAIEANAPPSPPPLPREDTPPPEPPPEPEGTSTPLPKEPFPKSDMPPPLLPPVKKERKRKADTSVEELAGVDFKLHISKELLLALRVPHEFDGAQSWVQRVVEQRSRSLLLLRRAIKNNHVPVFHGFDYSADVTGFLGWSTEEVESAAASAADMSRRSTTRLSEDSDDDSAFFEQSSLSSENSTASSHTPTAAESARSERESAEAAEWAAWRAHVAARAAVQQARPALDVRALASTVLSTLPPGESVAFNAVLGQAAKEDADVSRLFLATLFLANAGNVEVTQGAPLSLNSFSLKLVSTDEQLYQAAADTDPVCTLGDTPAGTQPTDR